MSLHVNILGTRGIPAQHGGFETFAEKLSLYLVKKGCSVTVYCQDEKSNDGMRTDNWNGIERVFFSPKASGPLGTIEFDFLATKHVLKKRGVDLVLGYNTAFLLIMQRMFGRKVCINMDGIEWKRDKWSFVAKVWFFINEIVGANLGSVIIADHPEISKHTRKRTFKKPIVIPYGAQEVSAPKLDILNKLCLKKGKYFISIARIEPENSVLELLKAFLSFSEMRRDFKLVVLGKLDEANSYHREIKNLASENVVFPGAVYDSDAVAALRYYSRAYLHGHRVGGTNPSLVEALGASCAVLAHNNRFNRWVTDNNQLYFDNVEQASDQLKLLASNEDVYSELRRGAYLSFTEKFTWEKILDSYYETLVSCQ